MMPNFADLRRTMVDGQIRTGGVTDLRLLAALLDVPRERFVPHGRIDLAYLDRDIVVTAPGRPVRKLMKTMVLAKLLEALDLSESDRVLDIGCATGYSAAVIGRLARAVTALEEDPDLVQAAKRALSEVTAGNVSVVSGPLKAGWPAGGPYDVIILDGATEVVPQQLHAQLKPGGRLACVLQQGPAGKAMLFRSLEGELSGRPIFDAAAPLLPGFQHVPEFVF
jgi:protein-L-isoaspartate(D-aspartate) O-methyltransferase